MLNTLAWILWFDYSPDHQSRIYIELSDQYKEMDAISNVVKRNVVAQHLKEVIDVLEQKVHEYSLPLETCETDEVLTNRVIKLRLCTTCCRSKTNLSRVSPAETTRESLAEA